MLSLSLFSLCCRNLNLSWFTAGQGGNVSMGNYICILTNKTEALLQCFCLWYHLVFSKCLSLQTLIVRTAQGVIQVILELWGQFGLLWTRLCLTLLSKLLITFFVSPCTLQPNRRGLYPTISKSHRWKDPTLVLSTKSIYIYLESDKKLMVSLWSTIQGNVAQTCVLISSN